MDKQLWLVLCEAIACTVGFRKITWRGQLRALWVRGNTGYYSAFEVCLYEAPSNG